MKEQKYHSDYFKQKREILVNEENQEVFCFVHVPTPRIVSVPETQNILLVTPPTGHQNSLTKTSRSKGSKESLKKGCE